MLGSPALPRSFVSTRNTLPSPLVGGATCLEVTAALASHSRDYRLTASSFFPCSIDREYLYGMAMQGMDTDLHYGFVLPTMALRSLFTG